MAKEVQYKEVYEKIIDYQQSIHQKNQKRIQVGIKVNIFLPLIFLILSFAISSAKLIFLLLWIFSLFGIAFYLIYVEFTDYKLVRQMDEFGIAEDLDIEENALIGENIQQAETLITERLDLVDERIEEEKQKIKKELEERREVIKEFATQKLEKREEDKNEEHH